MLRHYDALGLLVPAHVDPFTARRSYDAAQLPVLNQLLALKGLGFSLDEVGTHLTREQRCCDSPGAVPGPGARCGPGRQRPSREVRPPLVPPCGTSGGEVSRL
ncbi:MerR family transcriptional regulator [Kribbella sp. NPDC023855]|uniref:MerR family transcriptional regulator n=1 Tax=Kribbella sp. NPDC023855 TaxID=3154698 RepID=UPI0033E28E75